MTIRAGPLAGLADTGWFALLYDEQMTIRKETLFPWLMKSAM